MEGLDRLIAVLELQTAALDRHAAAMNAVADSHAQLLAALLMPEEEPEPQSDAHMDEVERTIALSQVIG